MPVPFTLPSLLSRLEQLQLRDDEKLANEAARNNLESHIFEMLDAVDSDAVLAVTTKEQREEIRTALQVGADWMDEEGYAAETKVRRSVILQWC